MSNSVTVAIHTLGCRVNIYESCAIAERLRELGCTVKKEGICDYYIVNTCAVTAESERKSRQLVRRCAKKGKVLVIGCASQLENTFDDIDNVVYIGGNRNKMAVVDVITDDLSNPKNMVLPMDGAPYENMNLMYGDELFSSCRAFIKIQDGCNGKCTYCIIPKCRGSVRSREVSDIISEAKRLIANGYSEIILTGIEVGAYNKTPLYSLVAQLCEIDGIKRLRLGSLSPNVVSDTFLETVSKLKAFMPHIHLSIQSCSDRILELMKRPYRKKDVYERVAAIRRYMPDCMISADIIVGFPGETESDFYETAQALKELQIFHVHSFPYSERKGTPAETMPDSVSKPLRAERNFKLIGFCAETRKQILDSIIGTRHSVLVEKITGARAFGHTENFLEACLASDGCSIGDIIDIEITSHDGTLIYGSRIDQEDYNER